VHLVKQEAQAAAADIAAAVVAAGRMQAAVAAEAHLIRDLILSLKLQLNLGPDK
jgi:hypothetical protein